VGLYAVNTRLLFNFNKKVGKKASINSLRPNSKRRYYEKSPHASLTVKSRGVIVGKSEKEFTN